MKNRVLFAFMMTFGVLASTTAQVIPNFSFENWATDTNYLNLTLSNPATLDTSVSSNPLSWTTSNQVTNGNVFHKKTLVTQSTSARDGASSIKLTSDSVSAQIDGLPIVGTVHLSFVCPGFAVCGRFPINLSAFANLGTTFNPALLPGAGIPSGRKAKIGGYVQYTPVNGDTAYIVAILRKGSTIVAQATYLHASTDANFTYFEAPFVYQNCLEPDTLVYTLSSGNPYGIGGVVLGGSTGLNAGSALSVDSIFAIDTAVGFALPPTVINDSAHTLAGVAVTLHVGANDNNCYGGAETVTVSAQPAHGTAVASADSIVYTPAAGFSGADTFYYTASVSGSSQSSPAMGTVRVSPNVGILDIVEGQTKIYPNPASTKLQITTANTAIANVVIYDVLGNLVRSEPISSNLSVDLSAFNEGIYLVRFTGSEGKVLSSSRFTVVK